MTHAEDAAEFLLEAAAEEEEIKSGSTLQTFTRENITDGVAGSGGIKSSVNPLTVPQLNQPTSRNNRSTMSSKRSRV